MILTDWIVLLGTLAAIILYGVWKSRGNRDMQNYIRGGDNMKWATIGLSVMATQASAITFLSMPGQAFESGLGFVQNYLGLPFALIVVSAVFIPIYYKLKVYTAYEYLEQRFDSKTRSLAALLFLIQRGMGAGITIYAPAIILSKVLEVNLNVTVIFVGIVVLIYTVSGGTKAVSLTQKYQMLIIFGGMFTAFFILMDSIPDHLSFGESLSVAGTLGKLEAIDFSIDFEKRYTFWSGLAGGFFLSLSYFGTDQSQVQRYLGGANVTQSRIGLMFNALLKIPMQFFILFVGVMVFVFYQFEKPPVFWNQTEYEKVVSLEGQEKLKQLEADYSLWHDSNREIIETYSKTENVAISAEMKALMKSSAEKGQEIRDDVKEILIAENPDANTKDSDYVFISFVLGYLPHGVIGLLLAVIFSAAMSSTAGELNALASTTTIDFYKRFWGYDNPAETDVKISRLITVGWGVIAILFALMAQLAENLIEFVNIIGSLFYGSVLGIFLVAFFMKKIRGSRVFWSAIIAQISVLVLFSLSKMGYFELGYLWYNLLGCMMVLLLVILMGAMGRK